MQYLISKTLKKLPEDYFEVLSKTRVKSSLLVLHDQITEDEFRYYFISVGRNILFHGYPKIALPSNTKICRAMADNMFNKSAIFYVLLHSSNDVSLNNWLQGTQ